MCVYSRVKTQRCRNRFPGDRHNGVVSCSCAFCCARGRSQLNLDLFYFRRIIASNAACFVAVRQAASDGAVSW